MKAKKYLWSIICVYFLLSDTWNSGNYIKPE